MQRSSVDILSAMCDEIAQATSAGTKPDAERLLRRIGPLLEWVLLNEAGPVGATQEISLRAAPSATEGAPSLDIERVTTYLRARFDDPSACATEVHQVVGGFSKRTTFVVGRFSGQPQSIVLRQVIGGELVDRLAPEYDVIRFAFSHGLVAPEPLWIEPGPNPLGEPFFVMRRQPGSNQGDVFESDGDVPRAVGEDLASFLARLHTLEVTSLASAPGRSMRGPTMVIEAVDACLGRLTSAVGQPDPLVADLFDWLHTNLPPEDRSSALVHGDVGLHNVLIADGRVTAVLDWERAHVGDPAEDLVYLKPTLMGVIEWDDFLAAYQRAGGVLPDPASMRFYQVWQDVWRYVACMQQRRAFERSRRLSAAFAGRIFAPRFLRSAATSAFGDDRRVPTTA